jgi:hypothetical protein
LVLTPCPLGSSLVTPQMLPITCRLPPTSNTSSAHCIDGTHSTLQVESSKCPKFSYLVLLHVPYSCFCAGANGANGWGFRKDKSGLSVATFRVELMGSIVQASLPLTCPSLTSLCGEYIFPMHLPKCWSAKHLTIIVSMSTITSTPPMLCPLHAPHLFKWVGKLPVAVSDDDKLGFCVGF